MMPYSRIGAAIIRLSEDQGLVDVARALVEGGIGVVEFTLNTPGALEAIAETRNALGDEALVGAGTVLSSEAAELAMDAGAQFIISPDTNPDVMLATQDRECVSIPGAYTPTEVATAMAFGADFVKLFPAQFLGPDFVRAMRGPIDDAPLIPTGGVSLENMQAYLDAGAVALALGSSLVNDERIQAGDLQGVTEAASTFRAAYEACRA